MSGKLHKEIQTNIDVAFDELCEISEDFESLSNSELIACKDAIFERVQRALEALNPYATDMTDRKSYSM
jgi:hypothetical protein